MHYLVTVLDIAKSQVYAFAVTKRRAGGQYAIVNAATGLAVALAGRPRYGDVMGRERSSRGTLYPGGVAWRLLTTVSLTPLQFHIGTT